MERFIYNFVWLALNSITPRKTADIIVVNVLSQVIHRSMTDIVHESGISINESSVDKWKQFYLCSGCCGTIRRTVQNPTAMITVEWHPFTNKLMGQLLCPKIPFRPQEWYISTALHFGLSIPILRAREGELIINNPDFLRLLVDPNGWNQGRRRTVLPECDCGNYIQNSRWSRYSSDNTCKVIIEKTVPAMFAVSEIQCSSN